MARRRRTALSPHAAVWRTCLMRWVSAGASDASARLAVRSGARLRPGFPADGYWLCWMRLSHFSSVTSDRACGSCCSYVEIPDVMPIRWMHPYPDPGEGAAAARGGGGAASIAEALSGRRNLILRLVDHLSPRRCVCVKT
jgi:hypothetical protein